LSQRWWRLMRSFKLPLELCPTSAGYLSEGGVKKPTIPTHVGGRSGTQTAIGRFWKCLPGVSRLAKFLAFGASDIFVNMVVWRVG
jgi:hypothetical protein